jgi:indole-3-glycerol phosphate synthase
MPTYLDQIMSRTLLSVYARKAATPAAELERKAAAHRPRGFKAGLRSAARTGPAVIAELKKASPSKGVLREDYRPAVFAKGYESVGAAAISVLTDEEFFKGSLDDLTKVSEAVKIPVLRKDFILDPYQILEARAAGADAVLLIVAAHTDDDLRQLAGAAKDLNLDVLCEAHTRDEVQHAIDLGCDMIGINSRDLTTMQVNPRIHQEMAGYLPASVLRVAESGIRTQADIERLQAAGYDAFLVGEALMRQPDPAAALSLLMGVDYASESRER